MNCLKGWNVLFNYVKRKEFEKFKERLQEIDKQINYRTFDENTLKPMNHCLVSHIEELENKLKECQEKINIDKQETIKKSTHTEGNINYHFDEISIESRKDHKGLTIVKQGDRSIAIPKEVSQEFVEALQRVIEAH